MSKFFISSDKKTVFKIDEIAAIKEDTKTGIDTVGYKDHLFYSKGPTYKVYLRGVETTVLHIDSIVMAELLKVLSEY